MICILCEVNEAYTSPICAECAGVTDKKQYSNLWLELHNYIYVDEEKTRKFLNAWQSKIPSFGCQCKEHWAKIVADFPPDFSSEQAFYKWGIDAHNKVNQKLGKPHFSYEEAKLLYGRDCV